MVDTGRSAVRYALRLIAAVATLASAAGSARAQATDVPGTLNGDALPEWLRAWSPLATLGNLPRELPGRTATFSELLILPAPRVGVFWTAGNPAGLPFEVGESRAQFGFGLLDASGECRRPLDAGEVSRRRFSGFGWGELGERGGVIGRVVVERTNLNEGAFANVLQPYVSNPFIVVDTLGHELGRTATALEGAGGWRIGRLGLGLALGYEAAETRTIASPVPRLNRSSGPGVDGGVAYEIRGDGRLRVGLQGRWRRTVEYIQLYRVVEQPRVYQLEGYAEPEPLDPGMAYVRRLERAAWALDLSVAGRVLGGTMALFARTEDMKESQFSRTDMNDPPSDRWNADGWTAGGAFQRTVYGDRLLLTATARYSRLSGETHRWDLEDVTFVSDENRFDASLEVRILAWPGWQAASRLSLVREDRNRRDLLGQVRSEIRSWEPGGSVEVVRWLGNRFALSAGALLAGYSPSGGIPLRSAMGPVFQKYVAPELALHVTGARVTKLRLGGRWQATAGLAFWAQGEYASLTPKKGPVSIPAAPSGNRSGWTLDIGALLFSAP
jgi:hypothetical protein